MEKEEDDDLSTAKPVSLRGKAPASVGCGRCDNRCPFLVWQSERMAEIRDYLSRPWGELPWGLTEQPLCGTIIKYAKKRSHGAETKGNITMNKTFSAILAALIVCRKSSCSAALYRISIVAT